MSKFIKKALNKRKSKHNLKSSTDYNSSYTNGNSSHNAPPLPNSYSPPRKQSRAGNPAFEVLTNIFTFVAPHITDDTYLPDEDILHRSNDTEDRCVLCDIRDLANASRVCLKWNAAARQLLYRNIKLESVHFCGLEEALLERRKRKSFLRTTDPDSVDVPAERMQLLIRTFTENESFTGFVYFVRMQYMTRQSERENLMKLAQLLPSLRYIDLPEGFYRDDRDCQALKALMYQKCPDLRRMRWDEGSEGSFARLGRDNPWQNLESVSLSGMKVDEYAVLQVLRNLPKLSMLTLNHLPITDAFFTPQNGLEQLPALRQLEILKCDGITFQGLQKYISLPNVASTLKSLALKELSHDITPLSCHTVLSLLPNLTTFFFSGPIARPLPRETPPIPFLRNKSLKVISFEIRDETPPARGLDRPSASYYEYLVDSLRLGYLPALKTVRVREKQFYKRIETTVLGLTNPTVKYQFEELEVCARGWDDLNWSLTKLNDGIPVVTDDDDFGAFILSARGGISGGGGKTHSRVSSYSSMGGGNGIDYSALPPARPRNLLGVPGAEENRMSWKQKIENRNSRMDLWR